MKALGPARPSKKKKEETQPNMVKHTPPRNVTNPTRLLSPSTQSNERHQPIAISITIGKKKKNSCDKKEKDTNKGRRINK